MNRAFWRGKRVFLTGHTGFKGSWMSLWLQQLGAHVHGYAREPNTNPSLFDVARVAEGMESIVADVRDADALQSALRASKPDVVFHMAAQPLVRYSYENPIETYATNVMGTANLLEAVRHTPGIRAVVNVTTDKCYENREWVWGYRENEPLGGHDPYSSSKACSEMVTAAYRSSFFAGKAEASVAIASARAGNVVGGGDWSADRIVADFFRAVETGASLQVRYPQAIRPWQHVLEPLSGYLLLAEKLHTEGKAFAEAWNFGPDPRDAVPVQVVVERMSAYWGQGARWAVHGGSHPPEANFLRLDCSKAQQQLGWSPRWRVDRALELTVAWHRAHQRGDDPRGVSLEHIEAYETTSIR